eukprot:3772145-Heterocapsa_arctica.AAC.2
MRRTPGAAPCAGFLRATSCAGRRAKAAATALAGRRRCWVIVRSSALLEAGCGLALANLLAPPWMERPG